MDRALKPARGAALAWLAALAAFAAFAALAGSLGCASGALAPLAEGPPGDLLFGRAPFEVVGTRRADRLTDGRAVPDGDGWDTDRTARLLDAHASVTWDLGEPMPVVAVWLQGDNNDRYTLSGSLDGVAYEPIFAAGTVQGGGQRARLGRGLRVEARFLRLTATGGDGAFGVAELAVFGARSDPVPPRLEVAPGGPVDDPLRVRVVLLGVALCLFAGLARRGMPLLRLAALALLPLAATGWLALGLATLWPPDSSLVSLVRATMAGVGLFVLAREAFAPARHPAEPRATVPALGVAALVAAACFWNLGHPQFYDSARDRSTFVHYRDLRVYYPSAKYHDELGYDGVYLASLAAYADDVPGAVLADKEVRDLRDHELRRGADLAAEIPAVRARFSDARWASFRADMRYFRLAMGVDDYLDSLRDHGANATPLWMALAKLVFAPTEASHTTLLLSALLDPLLLALMFVCIGRTFGWRTMLVALLVFGATDFYMYGSNWGGATLRHDWMVALGLGL
ncbi:MAG: discoidin domain-containing protein, partial [Polyangiaceae bacterium]|nr:discoidin domain-containing protein [Polyangiaceae bacterium]